MARAMQETTTPPSPADANHDASAISHTLTDPSSFFIQERERLIAEIAESLGEIMINTNARNRKIEESVLVGKEFEPVAHLWGKFAAMMGTGGLHDQQQYPDSAAPQQQQAAPSSSLHASSTLGASRSDRQQTQPPIEVAPGGGTWSTNVDPSQR